MKRENQFGPLQVVTFYQPTTVDKEPNKNFLVNFLRGICKLSSAEKFLDKSNQQY
jgi:hypothetical protein